MTTKKKGRGGGSARQQQQPLNQQQQNPNQPQQPNNGRHTTHQNQYLQQRRQLQMQRNSRCRLFYLQRHLVLNCFNYLDQGGREAAFSVMGWSMENHQRHKQAMQRQRQIMESVKERQEWKKNIFKQVLNVEETRNANDEKGGNEDASLCKDVETRMVVSDSAHPDESRGEEEEEDREKFHDVLPPLFARVDADTLLARLNTRRLYKRLLHYRREDRRRLAEHLAKYANADGDGDTNGNGIVEESIVDIYEGDLKNHKTANRIYPKNMTISQMAQKEWNDLLVVAGMRNQGKELPYDPFPTQYELLLFSATQRAVAALASYPRSGNSLMRTMYEHTSLRVTGSDMQGGLAKHDLVGEMSVGCDKVQFVKTHFPERRGSPQFRCCRAVLLVRNPFDAIESHYNLMMTGTHTQNISPEIREKATKYWEEFAVKEIRVWKNFHKYWLQQQIPILLVRYEDLIREPAKVMSRVVQFVLEINDMGSFFGDRIDRCIKEQQEIERLGSYKPRSGGIGKSLAKYSPELIEKMKAEGFEEILEALHYGDLLKKPVEEWSKLPFLPEHALEFESSQDLIVVNQGDLSRTEKESTKWNMVKKELGIHCDCVHCKAKRSGKAEN
mmetsp:Transcript_3125/g.5272  ORF Transcript_3125/g.5272 Transcript_3125/m.5272 type:complete len:613 (-) Transcript_3125:1225-3063(-)